jgi:hypothetical protein
VRSAAQTTVTVLSRDCGPDLRFAVEVSDGRTLSMERWTLDRIKDYMARGARIEEAA